MECKNATLCRDCNLIKLQGVSEHEKRLGFKKRTVNIPMLVLTKAVNFSHSFHGIEGITNQVPLTRVFSPKSGFYHAQDRHIRSHCFQQKTSSKIAFKCLHFLHSFPSPSYFVSIFNILSLLKLSWKSTEPIRTTIFALKLKYDVLHLHRIKIFLQQFLSIGVVVKLGVTGLL